MSQPTGAVFFRGPSELTGEPIVGIVVGLSAHQSHVNRKTGAMAQAYILVDGVLPTEAVKQGLDDAICGDCPHRGVLGKKRSCYVNLGWSVNRIYRAYVEGAYPPFTPDMVHGLDVRMGAYGDPSAFLFEVWEHLLSEADGWTGYTEKWRTCDPRFKQLCMASVLSRAEAQEAHALGWRTYRMRPFGGVIEADEVICPASTEAKAAGHKAVECRDCQLCRGLGSAGKHVVIQPHGWAAPFASNRLLPLVEVENGV
jgi:hypothetical protein